MKSPSITTLVMLLLAMSFSSIAQEKAEKPELSDQQIKQILISESISSYPGNCPCPYNVARNGSRCGKRSAWSKAGGYSPLCYEADVPQSAVDNYRKRIQ